MILEFELPDTAESRAALDQLRGVVQAVNQASLTASVADAEVVLRTTTQRARLSPSVKAEIAVPPACDGVVMATLWPWVRHLHLLSGFASPSSTAAAEAAVRPRPVHQFGRQTAVPRPQQTVDGQIQWEDDKVWHTAAGPTPIAQMGEEWLWQTAAWCVRQAIPCWSSIGSPGGQHSPPALAAPRWLSQQPAFRALVQEAVRRGVTFPDDVFAFVQRYLVGVTTEVVPWQDPAKTAQREQLAAVLTLQTNPGRNSFRRRIVVDANRDPLGADK